MGSKAALEAVSDLINARPTTEDFQQFFSEILAEKNDRGAAILLGTYVENALKQTISRYLNLSERHRKELFGFECPLGSFSHKIRVAHALTIFGDEMRGNLDIIRTIRNAFAHSMTPISFSTSQIADVCALLKMPANFFGGGAVTPPEFEKLTGRERFRQVCETTVGNLNVHTFRGPIFIPAQAITIPLPANHEAWATHPPLP